MRIDAVIKRMCHGRYAARGARRNKAAARRTAKRIARRIMANYTRVSECS